MRWFKKKKRWNAPVPVIKLWVSYNPNIKEYQKDNRGQVINGCFDYVSLLCSIGYMPILVTLREEIKK